MRTLADLGKGERAVLGELTVGDQVIAARLMQHGLLPGVTIEVAGAAPGGDPRVFRVDGVEVALRLETARGVLLEAAS